MLTAFPKIFSLGTTYIKDIFNEDVEITEKVDGSQLVWASINGELHMRSKGAILYPETHQKMFADGVMYLMQIHAQGMIPENIVFFGEYLRAPKHNLLAYSSIPKNHIALFGASHYKSQEYIPQIAVFAELMNIDTVPVIFTGKVTGPEFIEAMLERDSYLGGQKIEGVVVKNYERKFLLGGQPMPLMSGKYVSEKFKEVSKNTWSKEHTDAGKWAAWIAGFATEARWHKAIQHIQEREEYSPEPRMIGSLIKEIHEDIESEEKENIKEHLWKHFKREIMSASTRGFPEWYKSQILQEGFSVEKQET